MMKNRKKNQKHFPKKIFDVKKSKFANRLKRVLPKFRGDRSEVRGVNGRSKFAVAAVRPPSVEKYSEAPLVGLAIKGTWIEPEKQISVFLSSTAIIPSSLAN